MTKVENILGRLTLMQKCSAVLAQRSIANLNLELFGLLLNHLFEAEDGGLLVVEGSSLGVGGRNELARVFDGDRLV